MDETVNIKGRKPGVMTDVLRRHYAGLAMQGMVSSIHDEKAYDRMRYWAQLEGLTVSRWIARDSFKQADAMLAEDDKASELERVTKERDELALLVLGWWEDHQDATYSQDNPGPYVDEPAMVTAALAIGDQP